MQPVSPVIEGLEPYEIKIGGAENNQPEFMPLPALRSPDGKVMSRWKLSDEERGQIAEGADICIQIATNGIAYPPTSAWVQHATVGAEYFKDTLALDDSLDLRMLQDDVNTSYAALEEKRKALEAKAHQVCAKLHIGNQAPGPGDAQGQQRG